MERQQESHETLHSVITTPTGSVAQSAFPVARVWTCGALQIEVLRASNQSEPPQARYEPLSAERLRGRGVAPALTLLKLLASRPHRFAPKDWLMEYLRPEEERAVSAGRLDDIASLLRGLLVPPNVLNNERLRKQVVAYVHGSRDTGPGYQLAAYPLIWLDADALAWNVEQAARLERFGDDGLPLWERANQLASRGQYLPDELYSDWPQAKREEIDGHLRQSIHALVRVYDERWQEAADEQIVLLLRTYWQQHPTDEDALRPLLERLGKQERYQEALECYARFEDALAEAEPRKDGRKRTPDLRTRDIADYLRTKQITRDRSNTVIILARPSVSVRQIASPLPGVSSTQEMFFTAEPPMHITAFSEAASEDCATWFSERLAGIMAFVTQWQGRVHAAEFQHMLNRELQVFDENKAIFHPDEYFLSRRSALLVIAALPKGLLGLLQQQRSAFIEEDVLPACAASVTACWYLLNGREFASVERTVSRYLPYLMNWAHTSSSYQRTAAYLASQSCLLLSLVASHRLWSQQRVAYCEEAVVYAKYADDHTLLVKTLTMLGNARYDLGEYGAMFQVYQEAMKSLEEVPRVLQSKVLMGLAHAYAQRGQTAEALTTLSKAYRVFPEEGEDVPVFLSADDGLYSLILFDGWVRLDLGARDPQKEHYECAEKALARLDDLPKTVLIPERIRLEITNRRAQAALGLGDLDAFQHFALQSAEGIKQIMSEKRRQELVATYKAARKRWPHESSLLEMAEVLL